MNRRPLYHALALVLAAGTFNVAVAADTTGKDPEFAKLDTNRDGYLSADETRGIRGFDKAFREADDNRDGRLDSSEFVKAQAVHERFRAGQYVDDSVLTAKVKTALLKDSKLGALAVNVETYKGTVQLSGFVDNESQLRRAAEVAAGVEGVVSVKNSLTVKG